MFNSRWHDCSGTGAILQQSLARLFNSHWHDCSTVTGTVVQQSLTLFFNSGWHDSSTVTGTVIQQSLAGLINRGWHDPLTVTGIIFQQVLARLFNSHWYDSPTVTGTIIQQSRARFFLFSMLAEFFNSDVHCWRIVPCTRNTTHVPMTAYCSLLLLFTSPDSTFSIISLTSCFLIVSSRLLWNSSLWTFDLIPIVSKFHRSSRFGWI